MKVGIVVVYLVSEENEKLLDIHLSQIEEHTHTPYAIYASVNRLLPRFRQRLERSTKVKICECPTTELRDREEHSFYLDYLVRHAVEDGVSHVVTLHVDSFPVRSDWIEVLTGKLSDSCVLVAIQESKESVLPSTACMMFHRDFYLKYRPTFLPSNEDRALPEFISFMEEFDQTVHSGTGYTFKAYLNGLSWHHMLRSNQGEDHHIIGSVYDDLIFHLGAATRSMKHFRADFPKRRERKVRDASRRILKQLGNVVFTQRAYENVRALVPRRVVGYFVPQIGAHEANQNAYEYVRASLLEDPESYLAYLRTGKRQ
jgi:hypothetical protein